MKTQLSSIGIIGLGRMGRCLVKGLLEAGTLKPNQIFFTTKHIETAEIAKKELGIQSCKSNQELLKKADLIVIAVKPQNALEVVEEIAGPNCKGKTFISIVASVSTNQFEEKLGKGVAVVRAMPNIPSFVGAGITAFCAGAFCTELEIEKAYALFNPVGKVLRVDEKHMNAVTGLSGSGPAYIFVILESLTDAGIKVGLPRDIATELAAHTVMGSAKMLLDTKRHPAALKDEVTTPAGCTIDGLMELEEGKLRVTLIKAVVQATKRARTLAKKAKL